MSTARDFFAGSDAGLALFEAVEDAVAAAGGFAYVWRPDSMCHQGDHALTSFARYLA